MNIKKIHHVAIICSEYHTSKEFYVNTLGFHVINETYREERDSYKLDLSINGRDQLELFSFPQSPYRTSYPEARGLRHLAFEVEEIESTKRELEEKGVEVEPIRLDPVTGKRFTFFKDPDDLPLEIYEH
ncbi:VOC family protein [Halobacillus litoralis]|uniref:SMU1112c/YaeR family gloxylase I-like metalloprotein n=1 Tax=Halobacillus litoralis TaxID=45668 RepID=UPI001CFEF75C|nr:VOC family protein [Halobacillus litoralis]